MTITPMRYWRETAQRYRLEAGKCTTEQLLQWEHDHKLVERAIEKALAKYVEFLEEQNIKPNKLWLRTTLTRLYDAEKSE